MFSILLQKYTVDSAACITVWKTGTFKSLETIWFEWPESFVSLISVLTEAKLDTSSCKCWEQHLQFLYAFTRQHVWETTFLCYSLHAASDSSDPSGHSSSPSHFHLAGMQWPLSQVKSDSAQVFFAARKKKKEKKVLSMNISRAEDLHCIQSHWHDTDGPVLKGFTSHSTLLLRDRVEQVSKTDVSSS